MSEPRGRRILRYALLYPGFFFLAFVFGVYWTFPYDHLRDYIIQEAERGGGLHLQIGSLEPSWLTGVEVEDVRVGIVQDDDDTAPPTLDIDEATARISLLSLMGGTTEVDFDAAIVGGGHVDGSFATNETSTHLIANFDTVDLRRVGPLQSSVGLPLMGRLDGTVDLNAATEAANTNADIDLTVRNLSVGDGETQLEIPGMPIGVTLARLNLGRFELEMDTERGVSRIETLHAEGDHAEIWGTGSVRFVHPLERSSLDTLMRIKFAEDYRTTNARMVGVFMMLDNAPAVAPARTPDGALQWRIQGAFGGNVRMVPSGRVPMPEAE